MRICLMNPPYLKEYFHAGHLGQPSPSLAYLAGAIVSQGHELLLLDAKLEKLGTKDTLERLQAFQADIVGISSFTTDMPIVREMAVACKQINPKALIVLGGAHPSAIPLETMQSCESFDLVAIGEGEVVFTNIIKAWADGGDFSKVNGIAFRQGGQIIQTPPQAPVAQLGEGCEPAWRLLPPSRLYYVEVSRGCPGKCSFCYNMYGGMVRCKSIDKVIAEIEDILDYANPEELILGAATFGTPKPYFNSLMDAMIETGLNKRVKWNSETRVDITDRTFIEKMKLAGCHMVALGVEAGDDRILKLTGKNTTVEKIRSCVRTVKEVGISTLGFFVFGHPYETKETVKRTSDLAVELNMDLVTIGIMTPWPGTGVYNMAKEGKGGYYLDEAVPIEGQNKHFGRRALLFKDIPIWYLQWMKIRTYILLYFKNGRYQDGFQFLSKYFKLAFQLIFELMRGLTSKSQKT